MARNIENKSSQLCGGGVNPSSNATFRLKKKESNMMSLLRRVKEFGYNVIPHKWNALRDLKKIGFERYRNKCGMTIVQKAFAFTLAETLIVMGIIGVVAALTIPNLNSSTADKEKVAKVKKVYSNFQDAYARVEAVYEPLEDTYSKTQNDLDFINILGDRLTEFMKVSKNCERNSNKGCFSTGLKDGNSTNLGAIPITHLADNSTDAYKFILADGTAVSLSLIYGGMIILFDIDGPNKGLHELGKDLFILFLDVSNFSMGLHPPEITYNNYSDCFQAGVCLNWILNNDNMDYLKADTSGKCPNGKVLSETVTSCK